MALMGTISRLQRESNRVFQHGSEVSARHIRDYTNDGYRQINQMLIKGEKKPRLMRAVRAIDKAIELFNLDQNITVYSGDLYKHFMLITEPGQVFEYPKYVSATLLEKIAQSFVGRDADGIMLVIDIPKGSNVLYIGENSQYYIENGRLEYELLIARDTRFKLMSVEDGRYYLRVIKKPRE